MSGLYQCRYCKTFMDAGELVYDPRGIYSRSYTCPQCSTIFEIFLDTKGNRIASLDTWWKVAAPSEKRTVTAIPQQGSAQQTGEKTAKQNGKPPVGPQTERPIDHTPATGKPNSSRSQNENLSGKPLVDNQLPLVNKNPATSQAPEPPKRINLLEMPVGNLPARPATAPVKTPVTVSPDLMKRAKNQEKKTKNRRNANKRS